MPFAGGCGQCQCQGNFMRKGHEQFISQEIILRQITSWRRDCDFKIDIKWWR